LRKKTVIIKAHGAKEILNIALNANDIRSFGVMFLKKFGLMKTYILLHHVLYFWDNAVIV
jgi:hypothetical protein